MKHHKVIFSEKNESKLFGQISNAEKINFQKSSEVGIIGGVRKCEQLPRQHQSISASQYVRDYLLAIIY